MPQAEARWKTTKAIVKAREALSLGLLKKWKGALLEGDAFFAAEQKQMTLQERTNAAMWLRLLWAKYYQYAGTLPAIRDVGSFEDKKALQQFSKRFAKAVSHLELALGHLRRYNNLYTQAMDRTKLRSQVYLQASLSLARDLEERIRSGKIYLAFLRYAANHWGDKQKIQKRLNDQQLALRKHKRDLEVAVRKQVALDKQQRKLASSMQRAQALFSVYEARSRRQRAGAITLITIGSIIVAGSAAGFGYGLYKYLDNDHTLTCNVDPIPKGTDCTERVDFFKNDANLRDRYVSEYQPQLAIAMGAFGGGIALGLVAIIVGAAIAPGSAAANDALVKSHNKHLEFERKQRAKRRNKSSLRAPATSRRVAGLPRSAPILGRW